MCFFFELRIQSILVSGNFVVMYLSATLYERREATQSDLTVDFVAANSLKAAWHVWAYTLLLPILGPDI